MKYWQQLNKQQLFKLIAQIDSLSNSQSIFEMEALCFDSLCVFFKFLIFFSFTPTTPFSSSSNTWCSSYAISNDDKKWPLRIVRDKGHLHIDIIYD